MKFTQGIINNARKKISDVDNNNLSYLSNNNNEDDLKGCVKRNFMHDVIKNNLEDQEIFDEVKTLLVAVSSLFINIHQLTIVDLWDQTFSKVKD